MPLTEGVQPIQRDEIYHIPGNPTIRVDINGDGWTPQQRAGFRQQITDGLLVNPLQTVSRQRNASQHGQSQR